MSLIASLLLLSAQTAGDITLGEVAALARERAGDRVLEGKQHGSIEDIELRRESGLGPPPGEIDYEFIERPVMAGSGCRRQRWTVTFRSPKPHLPGSFPDSATLLRVAGPQKQIMLPQIVGRTLGRQDSCAIPLYADLLAIDSEAGLRALRVYSEILSGERRVQFDCRSQTDPKLCESADSIRATLSNQSILFVQGLGSRVAIGVGRPGTSVTFDPDKPDAALVTQIIPAPF